MFGLQLNDQRGKKTNIKIKIISRPIVDQLKAKRTFEERLYK